MNCCSDCIRTNAPYLESSEQLDSFFPAYPNKIELDISQNISKFSIYRLRPFKHNNTCDLCDKIIDKDKRGIIKAKMFLYEEIIDFFDEFFYIPTIEKLSFHLAHVRIIGSIECGKTINYCFHDNESKENINLEKYYSEKSSKKSGIEIQN